MDSFIKALQIDLLRRINSAIGDINSYPRHENIGKEFVPYTIERFLEIKKALKKPGSTLAQYKILYKEFRSIHSFRYLVIKNYNTPEIFFGKIVSQIYDEHRINALPPIVSTISDHHAYYWVLPRWDIIFLPSGEENSLLNLPDIYHEIGHLLCAMFERKSSEITKNEIDRYFVTVKISAKYKKYTYNLWKNWWIEEFTCDLIATYMTGIAYAWTHLKLLSYKNENESESIYKYYKYHPSDEARMRVILLMLDKMGCGQEKVKIESVWKTFLADNAKSKPSDYNLLYPQHILQMMVDECFTFYQNADLASYLEVKDTTDSISGLLNRAWENARNDSVHYFDFENASISDLKLKYGL